MRIDLTRQEARAIKRLLDDYVTRHYSDSIDHQALEIAREKLKEVLRV